MDDASLRLGGSRAARTDCLPIGGGIGTLLACFWMEVLWPIGLESGGGSVRSVTVRLRDGGFFSAFAGHRGAALRWRGGFYNGNVPGRAARSSLFYYGTAGGDSERCLWALGDFRSGADSAHICSAVFGQDTRLDGPVQRTALRHRNAGGGRDSGDHDYSDHFIDYPRGADRGSATPTRGGVGLGRDAL